MRLSMVTHIQLITVLIKPMLQSSVIGRKTIYCQRHKSETATHLCTDIKCVNSPVLCTLCFRDQLNRNYHYDHQKSILPYDEAINTLCDLIKTQTIPLQKIYKSTVGRSEFVHILAEMEKGQQLYEELEDKIITIKSQVELELQILVKQFQRLLIVQKQEYFKMLDMYKKSFVKNMDYLKSHAQLVMEFNNSIKYFSNKNSFYLKLSSESRKKSDWIGKVKKVLLNSQKSIESPSFSTELSHTLSTFQRLKLSAMPSWKGDENNNEKINELKYFLKKAISQWIYIPDMKNLQDEINLGGSSPQGLGANKNYYF